MTDMSKLDPALKNIIQLFKLEPLPGEGGFFRRTLIDEHSSCIYYAVGDHEYSAFHRLSGVETYHFYAGDPLEIFLLYPDGSHEIVLLGNDFEAGEVPQLVVPAGIWQGSNSLGSWTLVGTTMAPSFDDCTFELATPALLDEYPNIKTRIHRLLPTSQE